MLLQLVILRMLVKMDLQLRVSYMLVPSKKTAGRCGYAPWSSCSRFAIRQSMKPWHGPLGKSQRWWNHRNHLPKVSSLNLLGYCTTLDGSFGSETKVKSWQLEVREMKVKCDFFTLLRQHDGHKCRIPGVLGET